MRAMQPDPRASAQGTDTCATRSSAHTSHTSSNKRPEVGNGKGSRHDKQRRSCPLPSQSWFQLPFELCSFKLANHLFTSRAPL